MITQKRLLELYFEGASGASIIAEKCTYHYRESSRLKSTFPDLLTTKLLFIAQVFM